MADELFELRNLLTLGNYQGAINTGNSLRPSSPSIKLERDVLLYRAYLAQRNFSLVLSETEKRKSESPEMEAIYTFALYLGGNPTQKAAAVEAVKSWISAGSAAQNPTKQLVAGSVLLGESLFEDALRVLHVPTSLEAMGLLSQTFIAINRLDLAENQVKAMAQKEDDSSITLLASARVFLSLGGDKIGEAQGIYQELSDKFGSTSTLLTGLAVCSMRFEAWSEAERYLMEALEKDSGNADILVNIIVCAVHTRKGQDLIDRYITQLKTVAPQHPWLRNLTKFEETFSELEKSLSEN